jgi:hypothetical protein
MELYGSVSAPIRVFACRHLVYYHSQRPYIARVRVLHALKTFRRPLKVSKGKVLHVTEGTSECAGVLFSLFVLKELLTDAEVTQLG